MSGVCQVWTVEAWKPLIHCGEPVYHIKESASARFLALVAVDECMLSFARSFTVLKRGQKFLYAFSFKYWELIQIKKKKKSCGQIHAVCDPARITLRWPGLSAPRCYQFSQFSSVVSDSLRPLGLQHARLPCPSPTPRGYSDSGPSSQWCHPSISSSVIPFTSYLQFFQHQGLSPLSQFFTSGSQSIGVSASASVLPMNIKDWSSLGWTGWISLQSRGLSRVFSNTIVQKHQFFGSQPSL